MSFQLGRKVLVVNDAEQAKLLFYAKVASGVKNLIETDDDYQTTTAFDKLATSPDGAADAEGTGFSPASTSTNEAVAQADMLRILGFGDFEGVDIVEAIGAKAVSGQKQSSTLTLTIPNVVVGQEVNVSVTFISDDLRGEFASHLSDYKKPKVFTLVVKAGETATTLATRLVAQIQSTIDSGWASWLTASNVAGVVTLVSTDAKVTFSVAVSGSAIDAGNATGVFATVTQGFSGRGTWDQLKSVRLETVNGAYVEDFKAKQVPIKGAKYSSYVIKKRVSRPDLKGQAGGINSIPSGDFEFHIYINESLSTYIAALCKWLNANVAKRTMYTATTADAVLDGEDITSATSVDAATPFDTPLV